MTARLEGELGDHPVAIKDVVQQGLADMVFARSDSIERPAQFFQAAAAQARLDRELTRPGTVVAGGHFPAPTFRRLLDTTQRDYTPVEG
ncbi:MAG TPA: hypothetical protein VK735_22940 [Pseudonocardia sp.]|nr:hypothetical protein [Pseudonocardia sp.]HTF50305.1 hypothetical protein [Pseudonocardia sp.]